MRRHPSARLLSSEVVAHGPVFDLLHERVELPTGLVQDLWVIEHRGAVAIAPVLDDGQILLVRQYRHAVGDWLFEVPAGRLEAGETLEAAARRELEEETGYRCRELEPLGDVFPAPGFCSEQMFLFAARGLTPVTSDRAAHDADEEFELLSLPLERALEAVARDAKSWIALSRLRETLRGSGPST